MNVLDNFKGLLFCHNFGVRQSIDVLDPDNQPGSGALGLTKNVQHQKYENKKEAFKVI